MVKAWYVDCGHPAIGDPIVVYSPLFTGGMGIPLYGWISPNFKRVIILYPQTTKENSTRPTPIPLGILLYGGVHKWGYPKNRWFMSWKIPSTIGWKLGVPLLGNLHIGSTNVDVEAPQFEDPRNHGFSTSEQCPKSLDCSGILGWFEGIFPLDYYNPQTHWVE